MLLLSRLFAQRLLVGLVRLLSWQLRLPRVRVEQPGLLLVLSELLLRALVPRPQVSALREEELHQWAWALQEEAELRQRV